MASSCKQQTLFDAPVEKVWELIADPSRFPDWAADAIAVTGLPTSIEKGSTYQQKSHGLLGTKPTTTYEVEEFDDLKEIKLRCQTTGYYSRWVLTEARGNTFTEVEVGIEPIGMPGRALSVVTTKGGLRRAAHQSLDGLRSALSRR